MYETTDSKGNPVGIKFRHHGGRKGNQDKPGKPPRYTTCRIGITARGEDGRLDFVKVLSEALAKPVSEIPILAGNEGQVKALMAEHGRRVKRVLRTDGDVRVVILRGDQFSRKEGRAESLKKAVTDLDSGTRANIEKAVLG